MQMSTLKPNKLNEIEPIFQKKGLTLPQEIDESEAESIHIAILTSLPNEETEDYDHSLRIVKTNRESLPIVEKELAKEAGKVFILHDGNEYMKDKKAGKIVKSEIGAKADENVKAFEEAKLAAQAEAEAAKAAEAEAKAENESLKTENAKQAEYAGKLEEANDAKDAELADVKAKLAEAEAAKKEVEAALKKAEKAVEKAAAK